MSERPKFWIEEAIQDINKNNISGELKNKLPKRKKTDRELDSEWEKIDSILNKSLYERNVEDTIDQIEEIMKKNRQLKQTLKYKLEDLRAKAVVSNKDVVKFLDQIINHFFEMNGEIELHE